MPSPFYSTPEYPPKALFLFFGASIDSASCLPFASRVVSLPGVDTESLLEAGDVFVRVVNDAHHRDIA